LHFRLSEEGPDAEGAQGGNSLACRAAWLADSEDVDLAALCPIAGPSGGDACVDL